MPRNSNNEIRIKCKNCDEYTESIPEITINKTSSNRYFATTFCKICNKPKTKYLNMTQIACLPENIKSAPANTIVSFGERYGTAIGPLLHLLAGLTTLIVKRVMPALPSSSGSAIIQPSDIDDPELINAIKILDGDVVKRGGTIPLGAIAQYAPLVISALTTLGSFLIDKFKGDGLNDVSDADVIKSLILLNNKIKTDKTGQGFGDILKVIMKYGPAIVTAIADVGSKIATFFKKTPNNEVKQSNELKSIINDNDEIVEYERGSGLHDQDLIDRCIEYLHGSGFKVSLS